MKKLIGLSFIIFTSIYTQASAVPIWPLQTGQIWEYAVTDSRDVSNIGREFLHVLDVVQIGAMDFYTISTSDSIDQVATVGNVFVNSDEDNVYIWDDNVFEIWALSAMVPEQVSVPYGAFDALYFDEGAWFNYFAQGIGYVQWIQFENNYTISGQLVAIHTSVPMPASIGLLGFVLTLIALRFKPRKF